MHHRKIALQESIAHSNEGKEREVRQRIQLAINRLDEPYKEVFLKSRFEGKKYSQIARELNLSLKTVEMRMGKALKTLREQLADLLTVWVIYLLF